MNLRVRSTPDALSLLQLLGYHAPPRPYDASDVGLEVEGLRLFSDSSRARGYGVLVAEVDQAPASLRTFARRLSERFHDAPLALLGVRNGADGWRELHVIRPRTIAGGGGAVSVARLTVDVTSPTVHDATVVNGLEWDAADPAASQRRIDEALDVERVTRRFFVGLNEHYIKLLGAVRAAAEQESAALAGVREAGGEERVALRIVTQLLFCYFLQRKGLLEGNRGWLTQAYTRNASHGDYYARVLEPLFYDALAKPVHERPESWKRDTLPFLNGGLFERHYGDVSLSLPDSIFAKDGGLLGFLDSWTFTVSEEPADESEVAVDPEMLGKVFEHLVAEEDLKKEGTVYTPRPVVQFMCREALIPYLELELGVNEVEARNLLLDDEALAALPPEEALDLASRIDPAVERIRVIDPAVGSGAFLLGMQTELLRLRRLGLRAREDRDPAPSELWDWKRHAIERSLFGVDVNPTAIELCRLRLWLSLLIEEEPGKVVPLPNLEYRTVSADALRDFVAGYEVQQTRSGALSLGYDLSDPAELVRLREAFFEAADAEQKAVLRKLLTDEEERLVDAILTAARAQAESGTQAKADKAKKRAQVALDEQLPALAEAFRSRDRVFPTFMPAFHAPDVAATGGWDVVVMNPPYVERKLLAERYDESYRHDLELHYGRTSDLMIHFALRALELVRSGGVISMIFNDSLFNSTDAAPFRREILGNEESRELRVLARTRCFENVAVTGGVVVAVDRQPSKDDVRYVENHGRPVAELALASAPVEENGVVDVGRSELWVVPRATYERLPHRALFRPSDEAVECIDRFEECAHWDELRRFDAKKGASWSMLSNTKRLAKWKAEQQKAGFAGLRSAQFTLLGLVADGGQGLSTADDRRFVAAVEGTRDAARAVELRERLVELTKANAPDAFAELERFLAQGDELDVALLKTSDNYGREQLKWPKTGLIRIASAPTIYTGVLSESEVQEGLSGSRTFVPFEKGDDSEEDGGARWRRDNPLVIDWSQSAVALLRKRAKSKSGSRKPYFRNESLWGPAGLTWNKVASYFRVRQMAEGTIPSDGAFFLRPTVDWLPADALLALLNAPVLDFIIRTFLVSRMNTEVGGVRRLPIPVLDDTSVERLDDLGKRAVAAKAAVDKHGNGEDLAGIETEIDGLVRQLYGIRRGADLWVVR
jgi:hypothetical protein